jgi:chromosome segregation ATPase
LQEVNERLATASSERGEYRQYLMEAQKELQNTRAELLEWSEGLSELKEVMEGLDGDLSDLFGDTDYANVVTEALSAARRLPGMHKTAS